MKIGVFVGVRWAHRQPTGYGSWVVFVMSGSAWYWGAGNDRCDVAVRLVLSGGKPNVFFKAERGYLFVLT